ncbi:MAG: AraC family transcriptional regulator [Pedobacter sp.]|nr:MAG: AraC family transcriptional regulator [Pedobacter sp.]
MKPLRLKVPAYSKSYIDVRREQAPYFANPWHFHEELEITFLLKSEGTKFIGDHISSFKAGEITLLGANLPHYWRNNEDYYSASSANAAEAIIIRFNQEYAGSEFLKIPVFKPLFDLLNDSKRGIYISNRDKQLERKLQKFPGLDQAERIISLTEILLEIATRAPYQYLCSVGYAHQYKSSDIDKIDQVYKYVLNNFKSELSLSEIAQSCSMNTSAFCRYFKKKTGKTFNDFTNEIRLGHAAGLLLKGDMTASEIAFDSGFNTPSYFNRLFKRNKGMTPMAYRAQYLQLNKP